MSEACLGMASSAEHRSIFKLQGGTGKHVDGDVLDPLQCRPFQALVQLSPPPRDPGAQGSLKVLPGFHAASAHFFEVSGLPPPAGGFTPLTEHDHPDLIDEELWTPVARLPARWRDKHSRGELPAPSAAPSARGRAGVVKALRGLAAELRALEGAPLQPGDYVIWDTRLPHTTGDPDALCGHERPRQVFYCAYTLAAECVALDAGTDMPVFQAALASSHAFEWLDGGPSLLAARVLPRLHAVLRAHRRGARVAALAPPSPTPWTSTLTHTPPTLAGVSHWCAHGTGASPSPPSSARAARRGSIRPGPRPPSATTRRRRATCRRR